MKTINFTNNPDFETLEAAGIILTCNDNMDYVISDEDYKRMEDEFPAAFDDSYIVISCEPEPEEPTYDVFFNDNEKSNNLGLDLTYDEALDIIKDRRNPYFDDYKGGSVSIVNTETEEAVYTEEIEGDPIWEDMSYEEKEAQIRTLDESYDFGQYDSVEEAADNVVTGYKEDPDWFDFRVLDVDGFREDLEYFIKRR